MEVVIVDKASDFKEEVNGGCSHEFRSRSEWHKRRIFHRKNPSDVEDVGTNPKRAREYGSSSETELYGYTEPDFNPFDKSQNEGCFSVGQIWAVYDSLDTMPRFYARIRKVFSPEFKLRITWLEPEPEPSDKDGIEWVNEGLPASCGKFRNGDSEDIVDSLIFSHEINWEKGRERGTYMIFPKKGEIWAVFKNWDIKWKSDFDPNWKFEYEFVEIISEYSRDVGASVAYLGKVKGFVSVFCRINKDRKETTLIPPDQLFRFSHMIPSVKLSGEERQGVPKDSFELDPASLPGNIEEISVPEDTNIEEISVPEDTDTLVEYPDPEFNDFNKLRDDGSFTIGQIWAVYDAFDAMPRTYALIREVPSPGLKLSVTWMEPDPYDMHAIERVGEGLPIACGEFIHGNFVDTVDRRMFSHKIQWENGSRKETCMIFPRKGEIWAIFKNWDKEGKSDVDPNGKVEYEFVEILSDYSEDVGASVAHLGKLKGFVSVFCRISKEGNQVVRVPPGKLFCFSHMIPSFKLTGKERNGVPKGSFELDPASLPRNIEEISEAISVLEDTMVEYPNPDFNDFEKIRNGGDFSVGQIWAVYDTLDAMPRFYAQIRRVFSPDFKLRITWMEPDPYDEEAIEWLDKDLPIACGEFRCGESEDIVNHLMFSHKIYWEKGSRKKGSYTIFPRKGEIWAVFKNLGKLDSGPKKKFEYEIVEILSEYNKRVGSAVAYLRKVKGFVSVYSRISKEGNETFRIPPDELFHFSHMIPSFKLTGGERDGVPKGSFELDPAALPRDIEDQWLVVVPEEAS